MKNANIAGYFRAGVGGCLVDAAGRVLIMRRADVADAWQMPQGGIDAGESPEQALRREMAEETGLAAADYDIEASTGWLAYELPRAAWSRKTGRGQTQKWFLCRVGAHAEIRPDQREFDAFRWVEPAEAVALSTDFRRQMYRRIVEAFAL